MADFVDALLRFFDGATARDIGISADSCGDFAIHSRESSEIDNDGQFTLSSLAVDAEDTYTKTATGKTKVYGFTVIGDPVPCDCIAILEIAGLFIDADVLSTINRVARVKLSEPIVIGAAGVDIDVKVTNKSAGTASYKGKLNYEEYS